GGEEGNVYTKEQVDSKIGGKSLANANQAIPSGEVREIDTTGARLDIKGLENKTNDGSYAETLVVNGDGTIGKKDIANIIIWNEETTPPNDNNIYIKRVTL
ncbi:hypothetical protein GO491_12105, partial [Flavobacteriaceae bacterium Ap0902]|nr:hypothetical protein [Flavobacteriaceae bacterium Ap0902]